MQNLFDFKFLELAVIGTIGSFITSIFGGWDSSTVTLIIFMSADYLTGLMVAGLFKNSKKTESGSLESKVAQKGLFRKGVILLFVLIAARLDILLGIDYIKNVVIIGFIVNEALSLVENAGLMGIPLPGALTQAIEILKTKSEGKLHDNH